MAISFQGKVAIITARSVGGPKRQRMDGATIKNRGKVL
jgi:hypothetical protein